MNILLIEGHEIHRLTTKEWLQKKSVTIDSYFPTDRQNYLIQPKDIPTILGKVRDYDTLLLDRDTFDRGEVDFLGVLGRIKEQQYAGRIFASTTLPERFSGAEFPTLDGQVTWLYKPFGLRELAKELGIR